MISAQLVTAIGVRCIQDTMHGKFQISPATAVEGTLFSQVSDISAWNGRTTTYAMLAIRIVMRCTLSPRIGRCLEFTAMSAESRILLPASATLVSHVKITTSAWTATVEVMNFIRSTAHGAAHVAFSVMDAESVHFDLATVTSAPLALTLIFAKSATNPEVTFIQVMTCGLCLVSSAMAVIHEICWQISATPVKNVKTTISATTASRCIVRFMGIMTAGRCQLR